VTTAATREAYVTDADAFLAERASREPSWLTAIRQTALARFRVLGFPTLRDEEWRFTPIAPVAETVFRTAREITANVTAANLEPFLPPGTAGPRIVFVNGRFSAPLSSIGKLPAGVVVSDLGSALQSSEGVVDRCFARADALDRTAFPALNAALTEDGAVVVIPANATLDEPVHVLYYSTTSDTRGVRLQPDLPFVSHPRTFIVAERGSQAKVIETYAGVRDERYLTNAVTHISVGENAHLEHYRVQRESLGAYHISSTHVRMERAATFAQQSFVFGGAIARNDIGALLGAEGIECTLNGLYLGNGDRLTDTHTVIDHAHPHCASHEIYKGMLDGRSRGVFNGKIFVRQDAQKTDAKQTNQVLLLSEDATINTKPQLEIFADDVKCTHGATVGQIDAEALFYLRSRGIGEHEARALLVHAFASDIIDRVTIEPLRNQLEDVLLGHLPKGDQFRI
jgi:Fe-S cluster assembly protein SufD